MSRRFVSSMFASLVLTVLLSALPAPAPAADYPTKPITILVQLPPGGTLDLNARAFAPVAEKYLGKPVVVVNKTGAAGAIGSFALAQANPDGYTLGTGWSAMTQLIIGEKLAGRKPSFNIDDYAVLGQLWNSPATFLVKYDSPWQTIQQVIEDVKAHPNTYAFSSGGIYSGSHLPMEIVMHEVGLKLRHVPFQGGGPAITALIGGHVHFSTQYPGTSLPRMEAKQLRCLAQTAEKRVKYFENIPTFKELGYPNALYSSWIGLLAPKGTPEPILAKLRTVVKQVASDPAFIEVIEKSGDQVSYADAEMTLANWKEEDTRMYKLLERLEKGNK
jgi:tripartite-type tricarboxylate transporter receptor subunit TctC